MTESDAVSHLCYLCLAERLFNRNGMMLKRQRQGSVVCPTCGRLVGVQDDECLNCGRKNPGLWGFAPAVKAITGDFSFATLVTYGCVAMYLVACLMNPGALMRSGGMLSFLSPGNAESFLLGASGAFPVLAEGRWWTVLTATWLHGGLLHIFFNLYWVRYLARSVEELYGLGRLTIIYVLSGAVGFLGTSMMALLPMPGFLSGARFTVGASAALCGLLGALLAYGRANRDWQLQKNVKMMSLWILLFGAFFPGIDNWAHIFGFLGGFSVAYGLKPRDGEAAIHIMVAIGLLVATVLAFGLSIWDGLVVYNQWRAQG